MSNEYDIQINQKITNNVLPSLSGMQHSLENIDDMPITLTSIDITMSGLNANVIALSNKINTTNSTLTGISKELLGLSGHTKSILTYASGVYSKTSNVDTSLTGMAKSVLGLSGYTKKILTYASGTNNKTSNIDTTLTGIYNYVHNLSDKVNLYFSAIDANLALSLSGVNAIYDKLNDDEGLQIIDFVHEQIHHSKTFSVLFSVTKNNAQTADLIITTPNDLTKEFHAEFFFSTSGPGTISLYEDTNITGGSAVTIFNRNRRSLSTSTATSVHTPTVNAVGTLLNQELIGATGLGNSKFGGSGATRYEWLLKNNSNHLFRMSSTSDNNIISLSVVFYEKVA
jgi:uncharacterized protein YoxC